MQMRFSCPGALRVTSGLLPAGVRVYAVGDIHGRYDLLSDLVHRIDEDIRRRPIAHPIEVYLGDYIDRGPDSKRVIDLLAVRMVRHGAICLRGNHESLLEAFLDDPEVIRHWTHLGALQTLYSYGLLPDATESHTPTELHRALRTKLPHTHMLFLQCLRDSFECGDFLFVHAGIRPGIPIGRQSQDDLLWIRDEFLLSEQRHEKIVVHGHTPVVHVDIRHNRINIDTGAWRSGVLTGIAIEGSTVLIL
jgi:serine/threonine protein phosphatase 1